MRIEQIIWKNESKTSQIVDQSGIKSEAHILLWKWEAVIRKAIIISWYEGQLLKHNYEDEQPIASSEKLITGNWFTHLLPFFKVSLEGDNIQWRNITEAYTN